MDAIRLSMYVFADTIPPAGYSLRLANLPLGYVNAHTSANLTVEINAVEVNTTASMNVSDGLQNFAQLQTRVAASPFFFSGVRVTTLVDGPLTVAAWLADDAGNVGEAVLITLLKGLSGICQQ